MTEEQRKQDEIIGTHLFLMWYAMNNGLKLDGLKNLPPQQIYDQWPKYCFELSEYHERAMRGKTLQQQELPVVLPQV